MDHESALTTDISRECAGRLSMAVPIAEEIRVLNGLGNVCGSPEVDWYRS
jgi:hypothetical protein